MLGSIIQTKNPRMNPYLKTAMLIFMTAAFIELFSFSRSHSSSQLALSLLFASCACICYLERSAQRPIKRQHSKKQQQTSPNLHILFPLFTGFLWLIGGVYMLWFMLQEPTLPLDPNAVYTLTTMSALFVLYAFIQLQKRATHIQTRKQFIKRALLFFLPILAVFTANIAYDVTTTLLIDQLATCIIAIYLFKNGWSLIKTGSTYLSYGASNSLDLVQLSQDLHSFESVKQVEKLQAWAITPQLFGVKCELVIQGNEHHLNQIIDDITNFVLNHYQIEHIHFDIIPIFISRPDLS
ncbi:hypothetical protein [Kurthia gibsonii]|uniref:Cation transporter n=1 Tax=Kurthia gibsonii TaxID=33946 RepID=A0ABU9LLY1_9BACL